MSTETIAAPAAEGDSLSYVRERLASMSETERARLAADTGVSLSTLHNIRRGGRDPKYGTVMALQKSLQKLDTAAATVP